MMRQQMAVPGVVCARPSENCFACGKKHPYGLHLCFIEDGARGVTAEWRPIEALTGFENVIHGGVVSTVLDEAMSKAVGQAGVEALTCELRVRLREQVAPLEDLHVCGWVVERHKRRIVAEASLLDGAGRERAHAWGTFLAVAR